MRMRSVPAAMCVFAGLAFGQGQILSPRMTTSAVINGKKITIGWGAPSMRGRKIMGALVPYGEVWCAGANDATSLDTEADLDINHLKVPRGSYTLWALPNASEWKLIVNKETGQWHTEYQERFDLGRVRMDLKTLPGPVERLKFQMNPAGANRGVLSLMWEKTEASVPITVMR